jgi:hypothetical protein
MQNLLTKCVKWGKALNGIIHWRHHYLVHFPELNILIDLEDRDNFLDIELKGWKYKFVK